MAEPELIRRCGTVALVGRPNAGKSTLLNRLVQEKLAIVSDKPQTTRNRIVGILSDRQGQMILVDTPGIHRGHTRLNRRMVQEAMRALEEADAVCLLVDASVAHGSGDAYVVGLLAQLGAPWIVALNKIDLVAKEELLPRIALYSQAPRCEEIVPVSARTGDGVEALLELLWSRLPEGPPLYDEELYTVHPERFLVAERIREKILLHTRQELPYTTAVVVDRWQEEAGEDGLLSILATVLVEKESQRRIVIGRGGRMIKRISIDARHDLEEMLGRRRIFLRLHVRSEPHWRESKEVLADLERELLNVDLSAGKGLPGGSETNDQHDRK